MIYISKEEILQISAIDTGFKKTIFGRCYDYIDIYYKDNNKFRKRLKYHRMRESVGNSEDFVLIQSAQYTSAIEYITDALKNNTGLTTIK